MPVQFLTEEQRANYGRFVVEPTPADLARYFYLDDSDRRYIAPKRGEHNRLGFAVQLTSVRYLGRFLDDVKQAPPIVLSTLAQQLTLEETDCIDSYRDQRQRLRHIEEICRNYGYSAFTEPAYGFRLTRWLYAQCWTGTDRPSLLFERATAWLLANKVILPGASLLERFVSRLRQRVERRLWQCISQSLTEHQRRRLEDLLRVPEGGRRSLLDQLRTGPTQISGPSLVRALERLSKIKRYGITIPSAGSIPPNRIASLARFATRAKAGTLNRLPEQRRLATLAAFMHTLEASAQDDALTIADALLHEIFNNAAKADQKARLRSIHDLDSAATILADACNLLLNAEIPDTEVRNTVFNRFPRECLEQALEETYALIRPPDDVFYNELQVRYRRIRLFLPALLKHLRFGASPAGEDTLAALNYLRRQKQRFKGTVPLKVVNKAWQRHVITDAEKMTVDPRAYTFCVLDRLRAALKRRDVFVTPSWQYADPRKGLLSGEEWEATRPIICRALGYSADPKPVLEELRQELDTTYRKVSARLADNPSVRFEGSPGKEELILSPLDKLDEPDSLIALRLEVEKRMPLVDLPEILLEIAAYTGFTEAFVHISEKSARVADLDVSLCAVLLSEACNTGIEPLVNDDLPYLRRDRLVWANQNYIRDETLVAANARLVSTQNALALAHAWGGGEVASADGMRFVVPVKTLHAKANPKYFGTGRGVTYYNLVSDQFTGLHAITVPGTLRDSLILLSVVLEQETELQPTQIMTDTGAYSDAVFGLFRLLGYRFSPRLADIGGTRFWRIDREADYGLLNHVARQRVNLERIALHWDDLLRLAGSLKLGHVSPTNIMRALQVGDRQTPLGKALVEFGRIDKTLHVLNYIDDEEGRRAILTQLNRGEGRHGLGRTVFHGRRGELRQRYREGQEDQLGALGLVLNIIILWNTLYMSAILDQLRQEGYKVLDEDAARLSPLIHKHINMLGRYSFSVPESVTRGELRPLRNPDKQP